MNLTFHGAAGGYVTGSCHHIDINGAQYLVDCGMFQGSRKTEELNWAGFKFDPKKIKYVFLTHAHLDHVGRLPLLVNAGFQGRIIATDATRDLTEIVLTDAAKLHEEAISHGRIKFEGKSVNVPFFTKEDIQKVIDKFWVHEYGQIYDLDENIRFRMREAGHILGSASFEIWAKEKVGGIGGTAAKEQKIVFTGDLGQTGARIIRDPDYIREADYVVIETTYGNRLHKDKPSTVLEFLEILMDIERNNAVGIVPVFAVERTQEILYELNLLFERNILSQDLKVYLDSPMAIETTKVFEKYKKYYDEDAWELIRTGDCIFKFKNLYFTPKVEQSKALAKAKKALIMAGSGMMTGGRILHHLIAHGQDPKNHIIFVGYQVPGTLGRQIIDGKRQIRVMGKQIQIRAKIHTLGGFSAHADQFDLLYYLRAFGRSVKTVFLVHGENPQRTAFAQKVREELKLTPYLPELYETVQIPATKLPVV